MRYKKFNIKIIILIWGGIGLIFCLYNFVKTKSAEALKEDAQKIEKQYPEGPAYPKLIMAYSSKAANTEDQKLVEEAVNEIVRKKLGIEIEFKVMYGDYSKNINRMLAGQEQLDIVYCYEDMYSTLRLNDLLLELDDLLYEHGQGIIDAVDKDIIDTCRVNKKLYGLPNNRDYAVGWDAYIMRKDILDKYGIAVSEIKTIEDLEEIFALVKEKEPEMQVIGKEGTTMLTNCYFAGGFGDSIGVHMDLGQSRQLVNVFATKEYKEALQRVRGWYLKGYMENKTDEGETLEKQMEEGTLFSYVCKNKPGYEQQESYSCGRELVCIQFGKNIVTRNAPSILNWSITKNTISPQKSMELLNLLYTDADLMNLLSYGIEGVHYVMLEDGHITFPEGKNINPFIGDSWKMPNQFITYVWEGNPLTLWEDMKKFNKEAIHGVDFGFNFDISTVVTKYIALKEIRDKYIHILENGLVNPEEGLEELNKELKANFIDEVIAEKQRQFDEFYQESQ